jgi:hypothetical protein
VSGGRPDRPPFEVWRTPIGEQDYRRLRADVKRVVDAKEKALAREGCAAADYRLSGDLADRFCSLHLVRDWRIVVGFPSPSEVAVLLIGRHARGLGRDVYGRLYRGLGISIPSAQRKKPPCCDETGTAPVDSEALDSIVAATKTLAQRRRKPG